MTGKVVSRWRAIGASAQAIDEKFDTIRNGIASPRHMLIGAHKDELAIIDFLCVRGLDLDNAQRHLGLAHGCEKRCNRNLGVEAEQGIARPEGVVEGAAVRQNRERYAAA